MKNRFSVLFAYSEKKHTEDNDEYRDNNVGKIHHAL